MHNHLGMFLLFVFVGLIHLPFVMDGEKFSIFFMAMSFAVSITYLARYFKE